MTRKVCFYEKKCSITPRITISCMFFGESM